MFKLLLKDIFYNFKLFFGTFFSIFIGATIIFTCLTLIFTTANIKDDGERFSNVDIVVLNDQTIKHNNEQVTANYRISLTTSQLAYLNSNYNGIEEYSFNINIDNLKANKLVGHNAKTMNLTGFKTLESINSNEIIIDEDLAFKNNLKIGDSLNIKTNIDTSTFIIKDIVKTAIKDAYKLQNYIYFNDTFSKTLTDALSFSFNSNDIENDVKELKENGYKVYSNDEVNKAELNDVKYEDISLMTVFITLSAICLTISLFVIFGALRFSVINRFKEIALYKILGFTKKQLRKYLLLQTLLISFIGIILALIFSPFLTDILINFYTKMNIINQSLEIITINWVTILTTCVLILFSLILVLFASKKIIKVSPTTSMKDEYEITKRISVISLIFGIIFILGGIAIAIFTPMEKGVGIGMGFLTALCLLIGVSCLAPLFIKLFNKLLSLFTYLIYKDLSKVIYKNVKLKASKFSIAAISIIIMITIGLVMYLNNFTYIKSTATELYDYGNDYTYVTSNINLNDFTNDDYFAYKTTTLNALSNNTFSEATVMLVSSDDEINLYDEEMEVKDNVVWLEKRMYKKLKINETFKLFLENGSSVELKVGGRFSTTGILDENYSMIVDYNYVKDSLHNNNFHYVYTNKEIMNTTNDTISSINNINYYDESYSAIIQSAASITMSLIAILLAFVALCNTLFLIITARKNEFEQLKTVGATNRQIIKMTLCEAAIVVVTSLLLSLLILSLCVGLYSYNSTGNFNVIVDPSVYFLVFGLSILTTFFMFIISTMTTLFKKKILK